MIKEEVINQSTQKKHSQILKGPLQLAFDITNKCNFKCLHCYNNSGDNDRIQNELKDGEIIKFIRDVIKMKPVNVCLCGGETFLRYDLICEITKLLSENNVGISLVTNGFMVTKEKAEKLFQNGMRRVQVSVDGGSVESHEKLRAKKGSYDKALNALKFFKDAGINEVGVAFTPTSFNVHEIKDAFLKCAAKGITSFRVQPLMLLGRTKSHLEELRPTQLQYRNLIRVINQLKCNYPDIHVEWGDPVDHLIRFRTVTQHLNPFFAVQANGDIVASTYLPVTLGNIRNHSILDYWNKGLFKIWEWSFLKNVANNIKCINDFSREYENLPTVWYEENLKYDLIDDKII